ncbi:TerB family tellurite resistance protein [Azospirillum sp. SYSU D00513]|uniref:TerB family tellurite resistance protein n=1 Tax=Azospirillum sp. SYSU D00513 TaxID=2812561 RepID=UPI001A96F7A3|nr:TerB family tellurite resistance protein [Azospirillum sp. SYSU D00513]
MNRDWMGNDKALDAVAAGCALLGSVDGADAAGVGGRFRTLLDGADLPDQSLTEAASAFDRHSGRIRDNQDIGEEEAIAALRAVKGDADLARQTAEACLQLAREGDELAPAQSHMARRLCESLNLSPTQFGL